jgi:uncharacterized protein (DUF1330 family)
MVSGSRRTAGRYARVRGDVLVTANILLNGRYFNPDRTAMRPYGEQVEATMAAYGGRYRRGLAHRLEVLEGDWHPRALGMLEFPTFEQAQAWYHSPEYAPLKPIRLTNASNDTILVDALADNQPWTSRPVFSDEDWARLDAFFAEAERRGNPPDRFHPGEPLESVLAATATEAARPPTTAAAAESPEAALERVLTLLPALNSEGRQLVVARCQALDAAAGRQVIPRGATPGAIVWRRTDQTSCTARRAGRPRGRTAWRSAPGDRAGRAKKEAHSSGSPLTGVMDFHVLATLGKRIRPC